MGWNRAVADGIVVATASKYSSVGSCAALVPFRGVREQRGELRRPAATAVLHTAGLQPCS